MIKILNFISGPRNISTTLMYSFANRPDTVVIDEPYYAHYLSTNPHINHPEKKLILASQPINHKVVTAKIQKIERAHILYLKNMAHHIINIPTEDYLDFENVFLIREPALIINSFSKIIPNLSLKDIGLKDEYYIFEKLKAMGKTPMVIDANTLLRNPKTILTKVCNHLSIPFHQNMLSWSKGPKEYDGVWAPYWYSSVHRSTGFGPARNTIPDINDRYTAVLEEANEYYNYLYNYTIK